MDRTSIIYRTLIQTLPDIIYEIDGDGIFTYLNDAVEKIGYLPADLIGKHFSVIIHPEDVDSVTRANVLMRLKGCVVGDENSPRLFDERRTGKRLTRKLRARLVPKWGVDGCQGALDVEVVSIGLYHYNGSDTPVFAGTLGLIRDITESQRSQKAIMRVEQHYRLLLENSSDIITILAHDGTVLYKSNSIQRILGFDPVELVGESEYDYIHPDDRDGFKSLLVNECNTGEEPVDCQFRYRNSEGVWRDLKSSVTPIVDLNGKTRCFVINSHDVSDRQSVEKSLKEIEKRFRLFEENVSDAFWIRDLEKRLIYISPAVERIRGVSPEEAKNQHIQEFLTEESFIHLLNVFDEELRLESAAGSDQQRLRSEEIEMIHKDGSRIWVEVRMSFLRDQFGKPIGIVGVDRDITQRKMMEISLRESEERYRSLVEKATDMIFETDPRGTITFMNPVAERLTGYSVIELLGRDYRDLVRADYRESVNRFYGLQFVKNIPNTYYEYPVVRKDGRELWLGQNTQIKIVDGKRCGYLGVARDITELKKAQEKLIYLSTHDNLTDLPNRVLFQEKLSYVLASARRRNQLAGVMFLDLDGFKAVNDSYGHDAGDMLLKSVARRLIDCVREIDIVSRLGGDEFTIILESVQNLNEIVTVAKRIIASIAQPFRLGEIEVRLTASVGISVYPTDGHTGEMLLKKADDAMYRAKERGKNSFHFFSDPL